MNKKNAINDIMLPSMPKIDIVLSFNVINCQKLPHNLKSPNIYKL